MPPAGVDISDGGIEVPIGTGCLDEGVVGLTVPNPDHRFCPWMTTLIADSLVERAAVLDPAELNDIDEAVRLASRRPGWRGLSSVDRVSSMSVSRRGDELAHPC